MIGQGCTGTLMPDRTEAARVKPDVTAVKKASNILTAVILTAMTSVLDACLDPYR